MDAASQVDRLTEHPEVPPPSNLALKSMDANALPVASAASHPASARANTDRDLLLSLQRVQIDPFDDCPCQAKDSPQECGQAHGFPSVFSTL
jgi:hypothetical protein